MEFAKFGKEIKSISEIEVMDFIMELCNNRVVVVETVTRSFVSARYYNEEGMVKYSTIAGFELEECRFATLEEFNDFSNGMEKLGVEFTFDERFMVNKAREEELQKKIKKEQNFLKANKLAATFMYTVCILAVFANASDFGLLGCIDFLSRLSTMYSNQIKTIVSGRPIWETKPSTLYGNGGAIDTFTGLIAILVTFVEYYINVEGKKSLKGFASYASEKWLLGGNL